MERLRLTQVTPVEVLPTFGKLYGCEPEQFHALTDQFDAAWTVSGDSGILGALVLRRTPAHGAELMGGAFPSPQQMAAATALVQAALAVQPQLYAYAEDGFFPAAALAQVGLRPVNAYVRLVGQLPLGSPEIPDGFRVIPISQASGEHRLAAQQTYSDRLGHTLVPPEVAAENFAGTDDALGRIAYDAHGLPAGICRAARTEEQVFLETPGVRADLRGTNLRQALLFAVCEAAHKAGATHLTLEGRGDTEQERQQDEQLGLVVESITPIYAP